MIADLALKTIRKKRKHLNRKFLHIFNGWNTNLVQLFFALITKIILTHNETSNWITQPIFFWQFSNTTPTLCHIYQWPPLVYPTAISFQFLHLLISLIPQIWQIWHCTYCHSHSQFFLQKTPSLTLMKSFKILSQALLLTFSNKILPILLNKFPYSPSHTTPDHPNRHYPHFLNIFLAFLMTLPAL